MIESAYIDLLQIHNTLNSFLTKVEGLGSPSPRSKRRERTQSHGLVDETKLYGGRVLNLEGVIIGDDQADAWARFDALTGAMALGAEHVFRFLRAGGTADMEVLKVTVESEVETRIDLGRAIEWGVSLVASDPRIYSAAIRSAQYDPTESLSGGGVSFPLVFPLEFSTSQLTHLVALNAGQFVTPPTFVIVGPVVDPIIDNDTIGKSLVFQVNLGGNDQIEVDVDNKRVTLNGASRPDLLVASQSQWFELAKGTNLVRLRGTGMTSATQLAATWRDARI